MNSIKYVRINNETRADFDQESLKDIDLAETSPGVYHILKENRSFTARILTSDFNKKRYAVQVNNSIYQIDLVNELDVLIDKMGFTSGSSKQVKNIKAPMPGLILDILVDHGSEVKEGDSILILEAMKMENIIASPRDGVIKTVASIKGDAIEKGQLLIEFE